MFQIPWIQSCLTFEEKQGETRLSWRRARHWFPRLNSPSGYGVAMLNRAGPVQCSEAALPEAGFNRAGADSSRRKE